MTGFDGEEITLFARTNARGQDVPFGIKAKDRQRHMYVIGKTGMGKSTLRENMAAQDIENGEGMCFIDPHGSAIEALLEYVPEHRLDDVVYFAPFDMDHPISFNIMEDVGPDTRHLVVSGLMSTFKKIWEDAWSARMEYILTNALLALIEYPDTTLLSVNRMLADKAYRDKVVDYVKDPAVKAYWVDEFANYTERFAAEALPAIQNKIGQFTGNPLIRNIIGQPKSSFDVRKMMDEKKILLVNLSKGLVGETNADLLGSMLITKIYLAAMSRAELPPAQMKQMPNFYFYVDEFQSFANSTFANILSEARKYHLNLVIAHQYVDQMEETVRNAVFGNVGTTISFRVGPFDAEVLEPIFSPPFMANDLVNLGFAQIYLTLMIDGVGSAPFSAKTLPPIETPAMSHKEMVIARSRKNFCRPRSEIQKIVEDLHAPEDRLAAAESGEGGNKGGFTKPSAFFKVGKDKDFVKQKDRLKQGLPRQKGPAQTPPTDYSKHTSDQSRDVVTDPQKKHALSHKSPEDLRSVLSKMSQSSNGSNRQETSSSEKQGLVKERNKEPKVSVEKQDKAGSDAVQTKPESSKKQIDATHGVTAKRSESPSRVEVGNSVHKQELQAILSRLSGAQSSVSKAEVDNKLSQQQTVSPPRQSEVNKATLDSEGKSKKVMKDRDVVQLLQKRFETTQRNPQKSQQKTHSTGVSAKNAHKKHVKHSPDANQRSQTGQRDFESSNSLQSELRKIVDRSEGSGVTIQKPLRREAAEKKMVSPDTQPTPTPTPTPRHQLGNRRQSPAFTVIKEPNAPDIQTVKRMLKHSGNEHPPGAPR